MPALADSSTPLLPEWSASLNTPRLDLVSRRLGDR
jgi:hypothetical protein